jgi:hypothetical protein
MGLSRDVWVAIVQVLGSIAVALITTLSAIFGSKAVITDTKQDIKVIAQSAHAVKNSAIPVGTIVASLLQPHAFLKQVGDIAVFHPENSKWILADGEKDIGASEYGKAALTAKSPDLRGMFLRGVNLTRTDADPDGAARAAGGFQGDATRLPPSAKITGNGAHKHSISAGAAERGWGQLEIGDGGGGGGPLSTGEDGVHTHDLTGGDVETRPKNVAVYYYLKINP